MTRRRALVPGSRAAANAAAARRSPGANAIALLPSPLPAGRAGRTAAEPPPRPDGGWGDADFHPAALSLFDEPPSPARRGVVVLLAGLVVAVCAISYFGRLASYASAPGKVQAVGRTKVLEAQQSGQVAEIRVRDGDRVAAGDVMVSLDPTDALAARSIVADARADLRGQNNRRRAEIAAARLDPVPLDPAVTWDGDVPQRVRDRETAVLRADLALLAGKLATLASQRAAAVTEGTTTSATLTAQKALVAVSAETSAMADRLTQSGWNSRAKALDLIETLRSQQVSQTNVEGKVADAAAKVATLDSQIARTRQGFASDATDALTAADRQIADLDQKLVKAENTLADMTLRAPVAGVVHASAVTTVGQFVRPSQQLMQIVPEHAAVEVVAYVKNSDVGLIRVGQDATIKVDSFTFGTYGVVDGTVERVGSDALTTDGKGTASAGTLDGDYGRSTAAQRTSVLQYPVTIRSEKPAIMVDGKPVALTPGMSVLVEIETENRRLVDYVASPLEEVVSTALHER